MALKYLLLVLLLVASGCRNQTIRSTLVNESYVNISGAMHQVMKMGKLDASILLDTIRNKENLYGLGPMTYLTGEITIVDGKAYRSTVLNDSGMLVEESFDLEAPFFVYANVSNWTEIELPDSVSTLTQLEIYLDNFALEIPNPFPFKLLGSVVSAQIHLVNLPEGKKVNSPSDAHLGQVSYQIQDEEVEVIGFYSNNHKGIFTHHDSQVHMHLITKDRKKMGHLDQMVLKKKASIFLPQSPSLSCSADLGEENCPIAGAEQCL